MTKQQSFDLMLLKFGYNTFALPKHAAMGLFEALQSCDVYKMDTRWVDGANMNLAKVLSVDDMPSLSLIGPVAFHQALENQRMIDEEEAKKSKT